MVSAVARSSSTLDRGGDRSPYERDREPIEPESDFKNEILILISAPLLDSDNQPIVPLSIQREIAEIRKALEDLDLALELVVKVATVDALLEVLSDRYSPLIIHFIGHGMTGADGVALVLETEVGIARPFSKIDFQRLLSNLRRPPCQLAFLNACHSEGVAAELLAAGVAHVVAINAADAILDEAARCFAKSFYRALLRGNTVQESFEFGRKAVASDDSLGQKVDGATLRSATSSEPPKFHLLPQHSSVHQRGLVFQSLRAGQLQAPNWENTNLASEDRSFIGRHLEIHEIAKSLASDNANCVGLHGMGGIGKTALVPAVGRWQHERKRWRDGVWFVELRNIDTVAAARAEVMKKIEEAIAPDKRRETYSNSDVKAVVKNLNLLLILDDLDALLPKNSDTQDFVDFIQALLTSRKSRYLLTSRETLPADIDYESKEIQSTGRDVAEQIFRRYAYLTTEESSTDLAELLGRLDGYPLAIRIAATYLKDRRCSLQDLKERLEEEFGKVLGGSERYANDRQRSLIASLNLSYGVLSDPSQQMFSNLALFPGGLTAKAARFIFGREAQASLENLLLFSMAEKVSSNTWRLPEPARQYALDKESWDLETIATHKAKTLQYFHDLLKGLDDAALPETITHHQINLKHFLDWGYNHEPSDQWVSHSARITVLAAGHWRSLAPGEELLEGIERALVAADRCFDKLAAGDLWKAKGDRQLAKQGLAVAQESYGQAITRYESIGIGSLTIVEQAEIQQKLGAVWEAYPNSVQAEVFYLRAFELYESAGALLQAAGIKVAISDLQRDAEQLAAALASYQKALEIYQSQSDQAGIHKAKGRIRQLQRFVENLETSAPFEVVTVDAAGEVVARQQHTAQYFREILPGDVVLDMISIPAGRFLMGSPPSEGFENEQPQHLVKVPAFFMGKYPVTQEQWRAIASQESLQVDRSLWHSPSYFSDPLKPVEQVSWYDVVEFCARLSKLTGRNYRLASEAEWEYACRAKTDSPFHFGKTITTELATYDGSSTYARERRGEAANRTTPVGQFSPNIFGLYDMHGNVWEWCQDSYHSSYEGAPTDGSAWIDPAARNSHKMLRGGGWTYIPQHCRSTSRLNYINPLNHNLNVGFRVVNEVSRAL
jgi:formylglycine-generating enzyme required for sulfatase activity